MTTPTPPPLNGQDIGEAQRAVHRLLLGLLAETDTTYGEWIALRTLTQEGPVIERDELRRLLADRLDADPATVGALLDRLAAAGHIREGVELTSAGAERYQGLLAQVGRATAQVYAGLERDDLATARRVLRHVTERASAVN